MSIFSRLLIRQDLANHAFYGNVSAFLAAMTWPFFLMLGVRLGLPWFSRRLFVGLVVLAVALVKDVLNDLILKRGTPDPMDVAFTLGGGVPVWFMSGD